MAKLHHHRLARDQISCLQLLDQGLLTLDDPELIKTHLPEIAELRILKGYTDDEPGKGEPIWEDPKRDITLRMLLTHTSGAFKLMIRLNPERTERVLTNISV